jgi:thiamine biosynthesis lipoprotein ApbE
MAGVARADWHSDARPKMGTEVSVYFWHEDAARGDAIIEEVFAEVDRINALMSTYVETSRISDINRRAADEPVVSADPALAGYFRTDARCLRYHLRQRRSAL